MMKVHHAPARGRARLRKHIHYPPLPEPLGRRERAARVAISLAVIAFGMLELYAIVSIFEQFVTGL